jgi:hypothetical protein
MQRLQSAVLNVCSAILILQDITPVAVTDCGPIRVMHRYTAGKSRDTVLRDAQTQFHKVHCSVKFVSHTTEQPLV